MLAKVMAAAAAVIAPIWGVHRWIDGRLEKKADKSEFDRQRDHIGSLFNKLEEHARRSDDRFDKVTTLINDLHRETMDKLDRKQDKRR